MPRSPVLVPLDQTADLLTKTRMPQLLPLGKSHSRRCFSTASRNKQRAGAWPGATPALLDSRFPLSSDQVTH